MKVLITGYSGFLGNFLCESLSKNFEIIKVNLRNIPEKNSSSFNIFLDQFLKADFIINCAASLKPKSKNDIFINQDFPNILATHLKQQKKIVHFIHISTLNVIIDGGRKTKHVSYVESKQKTHSE